MHVLFGRDCQLSGRTQANRIKSRVVKWARQLYIYTFSSIYIYIISVGEDRIRMDKGGSRGRWMEISTNSFSLSLCSPSLCPTKEHQTGRLEWYVSFFILLFVSNLVISFMLCPLPPSLLTSFLSIPTCSSNISPLKYT